MKKKGFTLIELLAVIVILAVITLIATPMILGVIEDTKLKAAEQSANGYIDAVEKQVITSELTKENQISDGIYTLPMEKIEVKGSKPTSGWLVIQNGEVTNYSIVMNGYVITKGSETVKGTTAADQPNEGTSGPTMDKATSTDTHKGIIYLDPTDLAKTCTKETVEQNVNEYETPTEIKTGCMKWYVFNDEEDSYTMILDHNTTARIKWNDDNINVAYEESNLYAVVQDLKTTSGWEVSPRLITAEEVNMITGKTDFDSKNTNSWYWLDTKTQMKTTFSDNVRSNYAWLYNNLNLCKTDSIDYGCTEEDNNNYNGYGAAGNGQTFAYWTSTPVGTAGSGTNIWIVYRGNTLFHINASDIYYGVRPVITVPKSIIA